MLFAVVVFAALVLFIAFEIAFCSPVEQTVDHEF